MRTFLKNTASHVRTAETSLFEEQLYWSDNISYFESATCCTCFFGINVS